jgi:DNA-binding GntR family transcriptional regulator
MMEKLPAHEIVYRRIRDMVLFGELAPGQAVTIQGLVEALGTGITPVREAIRRLTAEGALEFKGNRRVCVPELTAKHLAELAFARSAMEPHLAEIATAKVQAADIDALEAMDAQVNAAIQKGDIRAYLEQNYRFTPIPGQIFYARWCRGFGFGLGHRCASCAGAMAP